MPVFFRNHEKQIKSSEVLYDKGHEDQVCRLGAWNPLDIFYAVNCTDQLIGMLMDSISSVPEYDNMDNT